MDFYEMDFYEMDFYEMDFCEMDFEKRQTFFVRRTVNSILKTCLNMRSWGSDFLRHWSESSTGAVGRLPSGSIFKRILPQLHFVYFLF